MVIRPAHEGTARPGRAIPGIDPARLAPTEREQLLQEIEIRGAALVAEEKVGFGTTPSLTPAGLVPKPYALRLFVTATATASRVMPGGLAMTVDPDSTVALSAPDGESRDVWVVSDAVAAALHQPVASDASRPPSVRALAARPAEPRRRQPVLARPLHRARRLDHARAAHLPQPPAGGQRAAPGAARQPHRARDPALQGGGQGARPSGRRPTPGLIEQLARNLMTSTDWYYGLPRTLDNIHRVASLTRDRLSLEAWRTLNDFYASRRWRADTMPTADRRLAAPARRRPARAGGLPWPHAREHDAQLRLVVPRHGPAPVRGPATSPSCCSASSARPGAGEDDTGSLLFVLELADSFITYRSRYRLAPMLPLVLDLLLVDESNPRASPSSSPSSCATSIPCRSRTTEAQRIDEQRMALALLTNVRLADVTALAQPSRTARARTCRSCSTRQIAVLPGPLRRDRPALLQPDREGRQVGARALAGRAMIYDVSHRTTYVYAKPVLQLRAPRAPDPACRARARPCTATAC